MKIDIFKEQLCDINIVSPSYVKCNVFICSCRPSFNNVDLCSQLQTPWYTLTSIIQELQRRVCWKWLIFDVPPGTNTTTTEFYLMYAPFFLFALFYSAHTRKWFHILIFGGIVVQTLCQSCGWYCPYTLSPSLQWRHNAHLNSPAYRLFTQPFVSSADQRKHQSSASLTFVRGIHRWSVDSPHKRSVT